MPDNAQDIHIDWEGRVFSLSGGDHSPVSPKVKVEYRKIKRSGEPAANLTRDSISILPSYCMFCGRKYEKDGGAA